MIIKHFNESTDPITNLWISFRGFRKSGVCHDSFATKAGHFGSLGCFRYALRFYMAY